MSGLRPITRMRRTPALIVLLQTSSDLMMRSVQTSRGTLVHPGMPCAALLHAAAPAGRAPIKEADGRAATSSTRTASGAHSVAAAVNHTASSQVFSGSRRQSAGFCSLARQQSGPATCAGSCSAAVSYVAVRRLASTAEQGAARPQGIALPAPSACLHTGFRLSKAACGSTPSHPLSVTMTSRRSE